MFTDPLTVGSGATITPGAATETCARAFQSGARTVYRDVGGEISVEINHQTTGKGRKRRMIKVTHEQLAASPYVTGSSVDAKASAHLVVDEPEFGFTAAQMTDIIDRLVSVLTPGNITKLLNGES